MGRKEGWWFKKFPAHYNSYICELKYIRFTVTVNNIRKYIIPAINIQVNMEYHGYFQTRPVINSLSIVDGIALG